MVRKAEANKARRPEEPKTPEDAKRDKKPDLATAKTKARRAS